MQPPIVQLREPIRMMAGVLMFDLFEQSNSTVEVAGSTGHRLTSREIAHEGRYIASTLTDIGFRPGDRLAVQLPNGFEFAALLAACAAARLVLVSVNTRYSDAEATDVIQRSGARLAIRAVSEIPNTAKQGSEHAVEFTRVDQLDDPFIVFTTSGTTNKPKLVRHNQMSIAAHGINAANSFGYLPTDIAAIVMPLCGTFGLASFMAALAAGCRIILVERFDPIAVAELIQRERVTVLNGSDDMFHRLLETQFDLSSIRIGGYARFNSSLDGIVPRAAERGVTLVGLYGMSEVQALFAHRSPDASTSERELAGGTPVTPAATVRIVGGELQVRGPSLFEGYLASGGEHIDIELTASSFEGPWFRTGDAATGDTDTGVDVPEAGNRSFTYHARLGDSLRLGGFLVSPAEIESALIELDGVTGAQVVAIDLPQGARPVAFVTGNPTNDEAAMQVTLRRRLAAYKVPIKIVTLANFPTTPSANGDKISRTQLQQSAAALLSTSPTKANQ